MNPSSTNAAVTATKRDAARPDKSMLIGEATKSVTRGVRRDLVDLVRPRGTAAHDLAGSIRSTVAQSTAEVVRFEERQAVKSRAIIRSALQVAMPPRTSSNARFIVHESWEGVVEEVCATFFYAQLASLTQRGLRERAEIYLSEVSPPDRELLQEGAVFYWSVGYEDSPAGTRARKSAVRFRRLPPIQVPSNTDAWMEAAAPGWTTD